MALKNKKNILVFIDWYLPGYKAGGPIRSCANLVDHLSDTCNFWIVTRDTDYCETQPYADVKPDVWLTIPNGSNVYYISKSNLNKAGIKRIIASQPFDAYYVNGVFSFYFSVLPLFYLRKCAGRLVLVATRGMLAPSALNIKKNKKKVFLAGARLLGLFNNVIFHTTNAKEAQDVKATFGNTSSIRIAANLPEKKVVPLFVNKEKTTDQPLRLVTIARIAPEKNLLYAIQVLTAVKQDVLFDVYGPIYDQTYWDECLTALKKLPVNIHFTYKGALAGEKVTATLQLYHFLFMPTKGENFGHVILQALEAACPLIISDQTPWRNLQADNTGWDLPLNNTSAFVKAIADAALMDGAEYNKMATAAYSKAVQIVTDKTTIEENRKLFF